MVIDKDFKIENATFKILQEHIKRPITREKLKLGTIIPPKKGTCVVRDSVTIDLTGNVTLSKDVLIQEDVKIFTHKHDWKHSRKRRKGNEVFSQVDLIIEEDVFIGVNSIIITVERIGRGAVIGAGAVLTKNVKPYEIWAGNPAKLIGARKE